MWTKIKKNELLDNRQVVMTREREAINKVLQDNSETENLPPTTFHDVN